MSVDDFQKKVEDMCSTENICFCSEWKSTKFVTRNEPATTVSRWENIIFTMHADKHHLSTPWLIYEEKKTIAYTLEVELVRRVSQ